MKRLLILILFSMAACSSTPPVPTPVPPPPTPTAKGRPAPVDLTAPKPVAKEPQKPQSLFIWDSVGPKGSMSQIAEFDPKENKLKYQNGGTAEQVVTVILKELARQSQAAEAKYKELTDICLGHGKPVPKKKETPHGKKPPTRPN